MGCKRLLFNDMMCYKEVGLLGRFLIKEFIDLLFVGLLIVNNLVLCWMFLNYLI